MLILGLTGSTNLFTQLTSSLTQSYYTWLLEDKTTGITYSFYLPDISPSPYYNEFAVTNIYPASQYNYTIYETATAGGGFISVAGNGILSIPGTFSAVTATPTYTAGTFTFSAYQNLTR
jgi:PKD repeat protein